MRGDPSPPPGLAVRGQAFWQAVVEEYEPAAPDLELLREACLTLDALDVLQATVTAEGPTFPGSMGEARAHPAFGELRQQRLVLARLLAALGLRVQDASPPTTERARRAAQRRWGGHA